MHIASPASAPPRAAKKPLRQRMWEARFCYLLMAPGLILIAMFSIYPLIASWYYSFFDWSGISKAKYFVGWQNFTELFHDSFFWHAFWRSAWFMLVATPVELVLSLLVAIVLNERALKLAPIYRTLLFIPVVTTTAIVSIVMSFVFAAFNGPINQVLQGVGVVKNPIDFLGDHRTVMWTAIGIFVWKWFGQPMIYWLAGLQTIPQELYEAARVDGAKWWRQTISITAPLLKPFAVIITLIVAVGNLQVFAFMQALTNGGPFFSSEVMELYIYRMAFGATGSASATRLGYASAAGVLFGVAVMLLAGIQALALRKMRTGASAAERTGL
ncbi:MAG TPA: sugar ABC transporter permease [Mycobacteriales bacterium]|jgi:multiple sugar transport system permease protein|nr:sugar ABC transporter permease [Mycobacteriales bacterium]